MNVNGKKMKVIKMVANKKDWLIFEIMHMIMISGKIPLHSIYSIWCKRDLNIEEFMKLWKKPEKNQPFIKLKHPWPVPVKGGILQASLVT